MSFKNINYDRTALSHAVSWFMASEKHISWYFSPSQPEVYLLSLTFPPLAITLSQVLRTFCPDIAGIWILMQFCCFPPTIASLQRMGVALVGGFPFIYMGICICIYPQYAEHMLDVTTPRILSSEACQRRCSALIKPASHFPAPSDPPPLIRRPWPAPKCKCQRAVAGFSAHDL